MSTTSAVKRIIQSDSAWLTFAQMTEILAHMDSTCQRTAADL